MRKNEILQDIIKDDLRRPAGLLAYNLLYLVREFYLVGEIDRLQRSDVLAFAKAFPVGKRTRCDCLLRQTIKQTLKLRDPSNG